MEFKRITLPYSLDSLEPYISRKTMNLHYNKHHAGYEKKLNEILSSLTEMPPEINGGLINLMTNYFRIKNKKAVVIIRRMGGGLINHDLFFSILKQGTTLKKDMPLYKALIEHFGDFSDFKKIFVRHAQETFGSGWAWLTVNKQGKFKIVSTANQDNPWMVKHVVAPILGIDVWEHAFYVDYENRKSEYIEAFFNVINWDKVNELYLAAMNSIQKQPISNEEHINKF